MKLREQLQPLGFKVVRPYFYTKSAGAVSISTSSTITIQIGTSDFCITNLWVFVQGASNVEGADFRIRNETRNVDYSNRISPIDSGTALVSNMPYATMPGVPSVFKLPWVVNAGDEISCYTYARYVAINEYAVVLEGFTLDTAGKPPPFLPRWFHFNGHTYDLPATTDGIVQEIVVAGPSDFLCLSAAACWDQSASNVTIQESVRNESEGYSFTQKTARGGRTFMAPNNERFESTYPIPFYITNGSVMTRTVSNLGTSNARRPEFTLFGYFDLRSGEEREYVPI